MFHLMITSPSFTCLMIAKNSNYKAWEVVLADKKTDKQADRETDRMRSCKRMLDCDPWQDFIIRT